MNYEELIQDRDAWIQEFQRVSNRASEYFQAHESLMVKLCQILKLDYLETDDEDVIECVRNLMTSHGE